MIHSLLLHPSLERLKEGYTQLRQEIGFPSTSEASDLIAYVDSRTEELNQLLHLLEKEPIGVNGIVPPDLNQAYRRLKLEYRFAGRRFRRIISTENRLRKPNGKGPHVSTFAA